MKRRRKNIQDQLFNSCMHWNGVLREKEDHLN